MSKPTSADRILGIIVNPLRRVFTDVNRVLLVSESIEWKDIAYYLTNVGLYFCSILDFAIGESDAGRKKNDRNRWCGRAGFVCGCCC